MPTLTHQDRIRIFAELALWLHLSWTDFKDMDDDVAVALSREVRALLGTPPADPPAPTP